MAKSSSFDVTTGVDLQEVDNAVNQARKEVQQRYDFKGTDCTYDFDREGAKITIEGDDDYKVKSLFDILQAKFVARKVALKNVKEGDVEEVGAGRSKQVLELAQGIPGDTAREIVKAVKNEKFKKVQVAIQGEELRVTSASRDQLQEVMNFLRDGDFGYELNFGNYR
jgi:uncharacterized protein YajQ (UPF0234 family)